VPAAGVRGVRAGVRGFSFCIEVGGSMGLTGEPSGKVPRANSILYAVFIYCERQ